MEEIIGQNAEWDATYILFFFVVFSISLATLRSVFSKILKKTPVKGEDQSSSQ